MEIGRTLWNRRVGMRDGLEVAADVLLPRGEGPWPAVVMRTPYMRGHILRERPSWMGLVDHGYAFVTIDVRGRGDSSGAFTPFVNDGDDGHDAIEWVASQSWCTGRVGMVGVSYEALTQWWTAKAKPPHLCCIAPLAVGAASMGPRLSCDSGVPIQYWLWWFNLVTGRTMQHPCSPSWEASWDELPLRDLAEQVGTSRTWWPKYISGEIDYLGPEFALTRDDWSQFDVPTLVGLGWWDDQATIANWLALQDSPAGSSSRLLIGAWDHEGNESPRPVVGGLDVSASVLDTMAYVERFLAIHLKEEPAVEAVPRCRVFRTGVMQWEVLDDWPNDDAVPISWYLGINGSLSQDLSADDAANHYVYDPANPVRDFSNLDHFASSDPPLDSRYLLRRDDVLVFTTEELRTQVDVSGRASFEGFVSVDRPDTDVCVSLYDVYPDGRFVLFAALVAPPPMVRLSAQCENDAEPPATDAPVRVEVPLIWLHHSFLPGHRIAMAITSSWFPIYARNLNSGEAWADAVQPLVARVTIHHGPRYPSRLLLPAERSASER